MALSDSWLKANHGKTIPTPAEKADRDGLSVRVSAKGKIKFQMRFYYQSKQQRCDIGTYPLMTLADARKECQRYRADLEQGKDPRIVKRVEHQAIASAGTLQSTFMDWYNAYCVDNKKGHIEIRRSFEIHVFPKLGDLPLAEISLNSWLTLLEGLTKGKRSIPRIAERILVNAKQLYSWAKRRRLLTDNVLAEISAVNDLNITKNVDDRALDDDEIRLIFEAIDGSRMEPKNGLFLKLLLHFGCRPAELRQARQSDFDFDKGVWTVPPENHKLGKRTRKPLKRPIIKEIEPNIKLLMDLCPGEWLITTTDGTKPLTGSAVLALPGNIMQWVRKNRDINMQHWSTYALRKTCRTNMATLTEPHIGEIILGHKLPGEWQTYDKHDYLPEQAKAYTLWWQRLQRILGNEVAANVVEMKRG
jgi:integrase